jgi:hypothetical protein
MPKQIVTGENSRQSILRGVNILADALNPDVRIASMESSNASDSRDWYRSH